MGRGQAERLMPLLQETLAESGLAWRALSRIAVGVGPGNFTGIRISVAAARGLALGLGIPAIGVSTLDAIGADAPGRTAAVPAPRGQAYLQAPGGQPHLAAGPVPEDAALPPAPDALVAAMARLARDAAPADRPKPLYIKPADAAPARDAGPVLLP